MATNLEDKVSKMFDTGGIKIIGWCVLFNVQPFHIDFETIEDTFLGAEIDTAKLTPTKERSAAIRVAKDIAKESGNQNFHRKITETESTAVFAVLETHADENYDAEISQKTKLAYDKNTKQLNVAGENAQEALQKFEDYKNKYTSDQFRKVITEYLKADCKGTNVRDKGGVIFVPKTSQVELEKLIVVSDIMGSDIFDLTLIPIMDAASAKGAVAKTGFDALRDELQEMEKSLEGRENITEKGYHSTLAKYQELKEKVETYEEVLCCTAEQLHSGISSIAEKLKEKLKK